MIPPCQVLGSTFHPSLDFCPSLPHLMTLYQHLEIIIQLNHLILRLFLHVLKELKVSFDSFLILVLQVIHFPQPWIKLYQDVKVKLEFLRIDIRDLVKLEQD